jgi:hypothetical protein
LQYPPLPATESRWSEGDLVRGWGVALSAPIFSPLIFSPISLALALSLILSPLIFSPILLALALSIILSPPIFFPLSLALVFDSS